MKERINVTRSSMPSFEEYVDEIKSIWSTRWLTNTGPKHRKLEQMLKEYLEIKHISLMVNGHMSLELGIQALNMKKGEIITTPFTFASTTHAIVRNGMTPVFCDINPQNYTIDVSKIENLITDKTVAIIPVHVYGNICDVEGIEQIAKKYNLKVVYDAAHAFGEVYKGRSVLSFGDMSMVSFHATKVFNTIEGGAICYNNSDYGITLNKLRDFGIQSEDVVDQVGANAKMNEFSAAMGICNLRHIDEEIIKRKNVVDIYREKLKDLPGIRLPPVEKDVKSNYSYFPVLIEEKFSGYTRNEMYNYLKDNNIYARKYFYPLTNEFECYKNLFNSSLTPIASKVSNRVLTLPLYSSMTNDDVDRVVKAFFDWKWKANA